MDIALRCANLPRGRVGVDARLRIIMTDTHNNFVRYGEREGGFVNYVDGANIAGFVKVADAMASQGEY